MADIRPISVEQALRARGGKQPSPRALHRQQLDADAVAVIRAVNETGAAAIDVTGEDPRGYLVGLRRALARAGKDEIAVRRRAKTSELVAWRMRPEDKALRERRRAWGAELATRAWDKHRARGSRS